MTGFCRNSCFAMHLRHSALVGWPHLHGLHKDSAKINDSRRLREKLVAGAASTRLPPKLLFTGSQPACHLNQALGQCEPFAAGVANGTGRGDGVVIFTDMFSAASPAGQGLALFAGVRS